MIDEIDGICDFSQRFHQIFPSRTKFRTNNEELSHFRRELSRAPELSLYIFPLFFTAPKYSPRAMAVYSSHENSRSSSKKQEESNKSLIEKTLQGIFGERPKGKVLIPISKTVYSFVLESTPCRGVSARPRHHLKTNPTQNVPARRAAFVKWC